MITKEQYFSDGHGGFKVRTPADEDAATDLLKKVNALLDEFHSWLASQQFAKVRELYTDPDTGSEISGVHGGDGDGGFRAPDTKTGAGKSNHRIAHAVDCYDPDGKIDEWLDSFEGGRGANSKLEEYGLYREAPSVTTTWCHLQDLPPKSKRRTYLP